MISILIIDDDLNFVKELFNRIIKQKLNIKLVGIGENGREAIKLIEYYKPDVLLLDLMMPHINGIQVLDNMIAKRYIYFNVAKKYHKKNSKIIKWSIDKLIDRMYLNTDMKKIHDYFNFKFDEKPSTKFFIYTISEKYFSQKKEGEQ